MFTAEQALAMRILFVEDEPDLLGSLAQALREEGYAVDTAAGSLARAPRLPRETAFSPQFLSTLRTLL